MTNAMDINYLVTSFPNYTRIEWGIAVIATALDFGTGDVIFTRTSKVHTGDGVRVNEAAVSGIETIIKAVAGAGYRSIGNQAGWVVAEDDNPQASLRVSVLANGKAKITGTTSDNDDLAELADEVSALAAVLDSIDVDALVNDVMSLDALLLRELPALFALVDAESAAHA